MPVSFYRTLPTSDQHSEFSGGFRVLTSDSKNHTAVNLESIISTAELTARPTRTPNYVAENDALATNEDTALTIAPVIPLPTVRIDAREHEPVHAPPPPFVTLQPLQHTFNASRFFAVHPAGQ